MTEQVHYILAITMSIATKLGRMGIYNEELPSIKSQGPLITSLAKSPEKLD